MCRICDQADRELLRLHVEGNPDAFACLFKRHKDRLTALARSIAGDDAEDALQNGMLNAHQSAGQFQGGSKVSTWLHRIVTNAALDLVRRRRPSVELPEEIAEAKDGELDWSEVTRVAQVLTKDQKRALLLVDVLEYPITEAAHILGISEGTVKSRAARGRARVTRRLEAEAAR